jgi:hypothetical protein
VTPTPALSPMPTLSLGFLPRLSVLGAYTPSRQVGIWRCAILPCDGY